jgi:hypothetical protein
MGQRREDTSDRGDVPPHAFGEELALGRHRRRCPGSARACGDVGGRVEERADGRHAGDAVRDRVVHAHEQPDPPLRQAGDEPHLPQRSGPVQAVAAQLLGGGQQPGFVAGRLQGGDPHVVGDVEHRGVHPQRPAETPTGNVQ